MGDILSPDPDKEFMCSALSPKKDEASFLNVLEGIIEDHKKRKNNALFQMVIPGIGEVTCTKIIQAYKHKRITYQGQSNTMRMIVKLYFAKWKRYRHWKRSDQGFRAFIEKGIPAPEIFFSGYLPSYNVYALVMEDLEGGVSLDLALQRITESGEREALLDDFMAIIAQQHEDGIIQKDLKLNNYMIRAGCIYSLDGDLVKNERGPVGRRRSIRNLAKLFTAKSGFPIADLDRLIQSYTRRRNWVISTREREKIKEQVISIREREFSKWMGKVYRSRGLLTIRKEKRSFSVYYKINDSAVYQAIHDVAERSLQENKCIGIYKYSLQLVGSESMMVWYSKGYGPLFMKRIWLACKAWENALLLCRLGIDTPQPVALVLMKRGVFQWNCFLFFKAVTSRTNKELLTSDYIPREATKHLASRINDVYVWMNKMGIRI